MNINEFWSMQFCVDEEELNTAIILNPYILVSSIQT